MNLLPISIKYKVMILLTLIPLLILGSYLILVIDIFEKDKVAYIFDTSSNINSSLAAQSRGTFISTLNTIKPIIQEYTMIQDFGVLSRQLFNNENSILFIGLIDSDKNGIEFKAKLTQNPDIQNNVLNKMDKILIAINALPSEGHIIRTPFDNNDDILLVEKVKDPLSNEILTFLIVFRNQELTDLFSYSDKKDIFLTTDKGEFLFAKSDVNILNKKLDQLKAGLVEKISNKISSDGIETLNLNSGETFLAAYSKIGFSNLIVTSIINKQIALSAIHILMIKSFFFAGFLFCITIIISIYSAESLTSSIQDLMTATKSIANGNFKFLVKIKSKDEVGQLTESFNIMSNEVSRLMVETAEKSRMESEIKTAKTVQTTLFPPSSATFGNLKIAGFYEPASECGGDWWYYNKINNKLLLCIGDATGHGVGAALITSAARSSASILEKMDLEPKQIMQHLNKAIFDVSQSSIMMTFFLGVLDLEKLTLTYSNASHESPFLVRSELQEVKKNDLNFLLEANNCRLGQDPNTIFKQETIQLNYGDFLFFYTDGITDIRNRLDKNLDERNFIKLFLKNLKTRFNPELFINQLSNDLTVFREDTVLHDDLTYFCLYCGETKL